MLYPDNIPGISQSSIDRANADLCKHPGRVDWAYIDTIFVAQSRVELQLLINSNPNVNHHWPEKYPVCGHVGM